MIISLNVSNNISNNNASPSFSAYPIPSTVLIALRVLTHLTLNNPRGKYYYYPHFTGEGLRHRGLRDTRTV